MKTHDMELREALEPCQPYNVRNKVVKRSFKRALNRLQRHGFTWYRGKLLSTHPTVATGSTIPPTPMDHNQTPHPSQKRRRLTCFSWNAGKLTPSDWDGFQIWAMNQSLDVITIQETHWPFTTECRSAHIDFKVAVWP